MKKFLIFLIIVGVILYFLAELGSDSEGNAQYNAETYDISDTVDPNDPNAYELYHWDGEDE